jgi:hypothetical protein
VQRGDGVPLDLPIPCRLYRIFIPDPTARGGHRRYIGECIDTPDRGPRDRFDEHCKDQPWGDTIPTHDYDEAVARGIFVLDPTIYPCKRAVKTAELATIAAELPDYNWKGNELNPHVIPPSEQFAQRAERDRLNNVPADRTWAALNAHRLFRPTLWRNPILWWRRQRYRTRRRIIRSVIWFNTTITLWVLGLVVLPLPATSTGAAAAALTTCAGLAWNRPGRRRPYARAFNLITFWAVAGAAAAVILSNLSP